MNITHTLLPRNTWSAAALLILALATAALPAYASSAHEHSTVVTKKISGKRYIQLPMKTNGSGVVVYENLSNKPALGRETVLTLKVNALAAGNVGEITVVVPAALGNAQEIKQALSASAATLSVTFTPNAEGLHYIQVFTQQNGRSSAAEIAVQVGSTVQKTAVNGKLSTGAGGEKIIEMKAQ
jgi:hypothetical protein